MRGRRFRLPISSLVMTDSPSDATPAGGIARVPLAINTFAAEISRQPSDAEMRSRCASTNDASPQRTSTPLRVSWLRDDRAFARRRPRRRARAVVARSDVSAGRPSVACVSAAVSDSTASRKVLLGMVPVATQMPPRVVRRSTIATRRPSFAACTAPRWPAGPLPMHTRS